jgi:hypothetical protein
LSAGVRLFSVSFIRLSLMCSDPSRRPDRVPNPLRSSSSHVTPKIVGHVCTSYHPGYSSPCPNMSLIFETLSSTSCVNKQKSARPVTRSVKWSISNISCAAEIQAHLRRTTSMRRGRRRLRAYEYERCPCSRPSPAPRPRPEQNENSASHRHAHCRSFVARQGELAKTRGPGARHEDNQFFPGLSPAVTPIWPGVPRGNLPDPGAPENGQ